MSNHSVSDQLRYVNQWFRTWSDYQKDDFLHDLATKLSPEESITTAEVNGLANGIKGISTAAGRPPTLFACQMKLFNDWWISVWGKEDRAKFTEELKKTDAKFWDDLQNEMNGTRTKDFDDYFIVDDMDELAGTTSVVPVTFPNEPAANENPTVPVQVAEVENIPEDGGNPATAEVETEENGVRVKQEVVDEGEDFKTTIEITSNPTASDEESVPEKQND